MKKHIPLALFAITIMLFAGSCEREGVYSPEKKISKIYVDDGSWKKLEQEWTWDGDVLQSISFYGGSYELRFQYDGKQLVSITQLDQNNKYYLFHYNKNGKRLDSLDVYMDKLNQNPNVRRCAHYDFSYNDEGLISGYEEEVYNTGWKKEDEQALAMALQCAIPGLPEVAARQLAKRDTRNKGDEFVWDRYSATFTYKGENVTECRIIMNDSYGEYYKFTYTDYMNPYYKLFQSTGFESSGLYSRNLAKTGYYESTISFEPIGNSYAYLDYQYEIKDQYPVKITLKQYIYAFGFPDYSDTTTIVHYYEYE